MKLCTHNFNSFNRIEIRNLIHRIIYQFITNQRYAYKSHNVKRPHAWSSEIYSRHANCHSKIEWRCGI